MQLDLVLRWVIIPSAEACKASKTIRQECNTMAGHLGQMRISSAISGRELVRLDSTIQPFHQMWIPTDGIRKNILPGKMNQ
mmetsp:Transcript_47999/g.150634  ORF Transcript_47999/g.150634 Transcript_47999/m.150634 type:complete len:81 (-) Transcript_47999:3305-3547(-)